MKFSGTHSASAVPIFSWFTSKGVFVRWQAVVGFSSVRLRVISAFSESSVVCQLGVPCLFCEDDSKPLNI